MKAVLLFEDCRFGDGTMDKLVIKVDPIQHLLKVEGGLVVLSMVLVWELIEVNK